ncbi:MAG: hydrogenase 4 subunit B [Alphaproteobacteria bacterium]|nr:hydrogenase 4 subunit B [Alphaproteobacteria bacterium]
MIFPGLLVPVLLGCVALGLFGLALVGAFLPRQGWRIMAASAALCGIGALTAFAFLLAGAPAEGFVLPLGPPGANAQIGVDALSGWFLLLVFVTGAACSVAALAPHGEEDRRALPFFPAFIGAMALTLLAADSFTLVFGFELMSLASWAMVLARHEEEEARDAALLYLGIAAFGAACLIPAFALLAPLTPQGLDLRFVAMRAVPPEGWRATAVLVLVLLGAGSKAGLAPLHVWLPLAHPAAPSHVSALMSGAMTKVALYVVVRVLFDLCGPVQPLWWAVPLLVLGAVSAVLGGLRASLEADLKSVLAASTIEHVGFIAIGLGLALAARAVDLPALASLALAAALLHALGHGVFKTLLFLCAGAAQHGAGSRLLARLGGLIHQMPVTTACALAGCAGLAALPPGPGFASEWLLFQSVLAAPRIGGIAMQTLFAVVAALMAMAAALAAAAAVRLIGVAFLGRPRTPRAAAAEEAAPAARWAMIGLAALAALLGLLPGPVLALAAPALRALTGSDMADRAGWLAVAPTAEATGYSPIAIALLLTAAGAALILVLRRWTVAGSRRGPFWANGFAAAPAWLPFGDPETQYGGASFAQPLRRSLGTALLAAREAVDMPAPGDTRPARLHAEHSDPADTLLFAPIARLRELLSAQADRMQLLTIRRVLSVMFAALVLFLAVIAMLEAR